MKRFTLGRRALLDLKEIWEHISKDSFDIADRVLEDFYRAFGQLADAPGIGHRRTDLTSRNIRFWPVHSYLVIYVETRPLRIVRIVHGRRNLKGLL